MKKLVDIFSNVYNISIPYKFFIHDAASLELCGHGLFISPTDGAINVPFAAPPALRLLEEV